MTKGSFASFCSFLSPSQTWISFKRRFGLSRLNIKLLWFQWSWQYFPRMSLFHLLIKNTSGTPWLLLSAKWTPSWGHFSWRGWFDIWYWSCCRMWAIPKMELLIVPCPVPALGGTMAAVTAPHPAQWWARSAINGLNEELQLLQIQPWPGTGGIDTTRHKIGFLCSG